MGTRGWYVFRYKNAWYLFYNRGDSYASGLGQAIVDDLRAVADWEEVKRLVAALGEAGTNDHGSSLYGGLMAVLRNPADYQLEYIQDRPARLRDTFDYEFVYTVDLDEGLFEVEYFSCRGDRRRANIQRFRLTSIPDDWQAFLI
jgi:hypothetical protein